MTLFKTTSATAYCPANGSDFAKGLKKIKTTVTLASHADETAANCKYHIPAHHALESWMDFQLTTAHYAVAQPTITVPVLTLHPSVMIV